MDSDQLAICSTAAELLAVAVCRLFPEADLLSGGANELGFYYDFATSLPTDTQFITLLEETMRGLAKEAHPISERSMMRENAADLFRHRNQPFKADLIELLPYNIVNLLEFDGFLDVAPSSYVTSTDEVAALKIYDIENITLYHPQHGHYPAVRVTGMAFKDKQQQKKFTKLQKFQQENDHRLLIKTMELFAFDQSFSSVSHFWLPKGTIIRDILFDQWKRLLRKLDIQLVETPKFVKSDFLSKNNFSFKSESSSLTLEAQDDILLPVQTPAEAHALLYKTKVHYAADLPIRYAEIQEIHSPEMPRTRLWGMLKTDSYLADFVHCFCEPDQVYEEIISSLQMINEFVTLLGFGCQWILSLNGKRIAGTQKQWDQTSALMEQAMIACGFEFNYNQQASTLVGPKIEARLQDVIGQNWSGPEVGVDFHLPTSLQLQYVQDNGYRALPIMIRQSIMGPLERLIALLVEKNEGVLPLWLSPEQVRIIAVSNRQRVYARALQVELQQAGYRVAIDTRSDPQGHSLASRIHEVESARVPYAIIVGDREEKEKIVNVRQCGQKATSQRMDLKTFLGKLHDQSSSSLKAQAS